jgi:lysophospholipase L1-like esterase
VITGFQRFIVCIQNDGPKWGRGGICERELAGGGRWEARFSLITWRSTPSCSTASLVCEVDGMALLQRLGMLLIAALLPAGAAPEAEAPRTTAGPIDRLDDAGWKARHEAKLLEARSRPVDLVLLGDSITANYELTGPEPLRDYSGVWQRFYADRHALNLGFSGDGAWHLLWRIMHGEIDRIAPKVAVVLIGTNDIGWMSRTAADTVTGISAVVAELHHRLPATKILLVGLLPSDRNARVRQATAEINSALATRYGQGDVPYVIYRDVSPVFLKDGTLDTSLFSDPQQVPPEPALHPTPEGQERMAAALEPTLSDLLGDDRHDR